MTVPSSKIEKRCHGPKFRVLQFNCAPLHPMGGRKSANGVCEVSQGEASPMAHVSLRSTAMVLSLVSMAELLWLQPARAEAGAASTDPSPIAHRWVPSMRPMPNIRPRRCRFGWSPRPTRPRRSRRKRAPGWIRQRRSSGVAPQARCSCACKATARNVRARARLPLRRSATPNAEVIPLSVIGHENPMIYDWGCHDKQPVAKGQIFKVDAQGYLAELWQTVSR
jgi:hypothetical protein